MKEQTAEQVTTALVERIILIHGPPKEIWTDNGKQFTSILFRKAMESFGIKHLLNAPYKKNGTGLVERLHRTIEESLSGYVDRTQTDWDEYLPFVMHAINSVPHDGIGISPFEALYGRQARLPEDLDLQTARPLVYEDFSLYSTRMKEQVAEMTQMLQKKFKESSERNARTQKQQFLTAERDVRPGDLILVKREEAKNKLAPKLHGPYKVLEVSGPNIVYMDESRKKAHKDNVRRFHRNLEENNGSERLEDTEGAEQLEKKQ